MKNFLLIIIIFLIIPVKVFAWCSEPMAPSAPSSWNKPTKPSVPFCVNEWNNTHTCDDWTITSYNNDLQNYRYDVENYQRELQYYVDEAQRFVNDAYEYANCEIRNLD